ncbi:TPA: HAD-IB family phosphatase [Photobacterium damselae]
MSSEKLIIFDVCGTIVKENTTFYFLEESFKDSKRLKIRKFFFIKIINKIIMKLFGIDLVKIYSLRLLKGIKKEELRCKFDKIKGETNKVDVVFDMLKNAQENKNTDIVLLSASLDFIIEVLSADYGINEYYSSVLKYDCNSICKGQMSNDILLSKHKIVKRLKRRYDHIVMVTDNKTDLESCKLCDDFVSICYSPSDVKFWESNGSRNIINVQK